MSDLKICRSGRMRLSWQGGYMSWCSRQIRGWADSLQNSDIKGQRHLNESTRGRYETQKRALAFEKQIQETLLKARPQDYSEQIE